MQPRSLITAIAALHWASAAFGQIYQTDFSTAQGWTISSASCSSTAQWSWAVDATPAIHFAGAFRSAPASLNFNDGATAGPVFGAVSCGTATSPQIDLSAATFGARVELWFTFEFNQASGCAIDSTTLEVSNDGFTTLLLNECLPSLGLTQEAWHQLGYDLDPAWGLVQLRFRFFGTNGVGFNGPAGPFVDDLVVRALCPPITNYCIGAPNTGSASGAHMGALGTGSVSTNQLRLYATGTATSTFGLFFYGNAAVQVPSGNGFVCVGGSVFRLPTVATGPQGTPSWSLDIASPPHPGGAITSGSTWHFQCWFRDGSPGWNYSDGLSVTFCD